MIKVGDYARRAVGQWTGTETTQKGEDQSTRDQ